MSLSKNYDEIYSFPIVFENIPIQKKPTNDSIILKTTINATGWDILFKRIKNRKVYIDLNQYSNTNKVKFSNTKSIIQEQFDDINIKEVNPSFFDLNFEELKTEYLAIKLNLKENFPPNYYITNLNFYPDSVLVTGDEKSLKETTFIETIFFEITEKDTYTILGDERDDVLDFAMYLEKTVPLHYDKKNLVIDLLKYENLTLDQLVQFIKLSNYQRGGKLSYVIVNTGIDYDLVPDEMVVVPTLEEAGDIIAMEEIERDLGF